MKKSVKVAEKSSKAKSASAKKAAPITASVKSKAKKRNSAHSVHVIERDFIIITSGGFLVIVMVVLFLFS